jgi:hypothetical protein
LFVNPKGDNNHYLAFWNFANRENGYTRETVGSGEKVKVEVRPILRIINNFIYDLSGGQVYLAQRPQINKSVIHPRNRDSSVY